MTRRAKFLLGLRGKRLEYGLIATIIFPAYTLFGWNNGIAGSLLELQSWVQTFPRIDTINTTGAERTDNTQVQGTVVAIYALGALFGALSCIWLGDPLGRRRTIGLGAMVSIVGVILETSAFSLGQLIVGRLIEGIGFGALSATAPNWQTECASSGHRGAAVIMESMFISLGLALQGWICFGIDFAIGPVTWRFPLSMSIFWALLVLMALPFVPESPRWLLKKNRETDARNVLAAIEDTEPESPSVNLAVSEIKDSLSISGSGKFADVFKMGKQRNANRLAVACFAGFAQQFCGINALAFYQTTIFETYLNLQPRDASILAASVFTWQTICSPIGVLTVDRFGRRKLMLMSAAGMGISMAVFAGCSSDLSNKKAIGAAAAFIFLFSAFFPIGFLGLSFLYASEVSPLRIRTYITSSSTAVVWLSNFVVAEMTPAILDRIQGRYYIVYACINLFLIIPVVWLFLPETNGRTLEEIDLIFEQSENALQPVKIARRMRREGVTIDSTQATTPKEKKGGVEVEHVA